MISGHHPDCLVHEDCLHEPCTCTTIFLREEIAKLKQFIKDNSPQPGEFTYRHVCSQLEIVTKERDDARQHNDKLRERMVRWLGFCELDSMLDDARKVILPNLDWFVESHGMVDEAENIRLAQHALKLSDLPGTEWFHGEEMDPDQLRRVAAGLVIMAEYLRLRRP